MARKVHFRRSRRSYRPAYLVDHRIINSEAWNAIPSHRDSKFLSMQVVYNPVNDGTNPGVIKTVKHLEVQVNTLPYWRDTLPTYAEDGSENGRITVTGVPSIGWICVYVPQGTNPSIPLGNDASYRNSPLYEPNQYVLGHGTVLQGQRVVDSDARYAEEYPVLTSAGNNTRIRVPLSKKLNPGDSIYLLVYALHLPETSTLNMTEFTGVVSYALKDNCYVCFKPVGRVIEPVTVWGLLGRGLGLVRFRSI